MHFPNDPDPDPDFDTFERIRRGDDSAVAELYAAYRGHMERVAQRALRRSKELQSYLEPFDLMQSFMRDLTRALREGKYPGLDAHGFTPLLKKFIHTRYLHHLEMQTADRRDIGRLERVFLEQLELAARDPDPAETAEREDAIRAVREQLSAENLALLDQRVAGQSWKSLAGGDEKKGDSLRMQLSRAIADAKRRLGFDEV